MSRPPPYGPSPPRAARRVSVRRCCRRSSRPGCRQILGDLATLPNSRNVLTTERTRPALSFLIGTAVSTRCRFANSFLMRTLRLNSRCQLSKIGAMTGSKPIEHRQADRPIDCSGSTFRMRWRQVHISDDACLVHDHGAVLHRVGYGLLSANSAALKIGVGNVDLKHQPRESPPKSRSPGTGIAGFRCPPA